MKKRTNDEGEPQNKYLHPSVGGSYTRQADGSLKRNGQKPSAESVPMSAKAPRAVAKKSVAKKTSKPAKAAPVAKGKAAKAAMPKAAAAPATAATANVNESK